jgi:uncharacterized protein (DUF736 family)
MAYAHKEGHGSMFANDKKGNDKAPDMTGSALWEGKEIQLAGWKTKSKEGKPYMSMKLSVKQAKQEEDDGLPF